MKRVRSKKPVGAPTRPKSAYMFFLGEFREKWKVRSTSYVPYWTVEACLLLAKDCRQGELALPLSYRSIS